MFIVSSHFFFELDDRFRAAALDFYRATDMDTVECFAFGA